MTNDWEPQHLMRALQAAVGGTGETGVVGCGGGGGGGDDTAAGRGAAGVPAAGGGNAAGPTANGSGGGVHGGCVAAARAVNTAVMASHGRRTGLRRLAVQVGRCPGWLAFRQWVGGMGSTIK